MVHVKDHRAPVRISWKLREGVKYYFADLVGLKPVVLFSTTKFFTQKCCVWQAQVFFRYSAPFEEKYSRECKTSLETLYLLRAVLLQLKTKSWQDPNPGTLPQVFSEETLPVLPWSKKSLTVAAMTRGPKKIWEKQKFTWFLQFLHGQCVWTAFCKNFSGIP